MRGMPWMVERRHWMTNILVGWLFLFPAGVAVAMGVAVAAGLAVAVAVGGIR